MSNTLQQLQCQFGQKIYIEAERVNEAFFAHLNRTKFFLAIDRFEIELVTFRFHESQKAQKYIKLEDLASFLDKREKEARYAYDKTLDILRRIAAFIGITLSIAIVYGTYFPSLSAA